METSIHKTNTKKDHDISEREVLSALFHIGVELIGSSTSFRRSRTSAAVATTIGIEITSKSTGRKVIVPYSNVKCFEVA